MNKFSDIFLPKQIMMGSKQECDDNEHKMGASVLRPSLCRVPQPGVEPALVFDPRESNGGNRGSSLLLRTHIDADAKTPIENSHRHRWTHRVLAVP